MTDLTDFVPVAAASAQVREKYASVLPVELIDVWDRYGFGSFYEGFLRVINPDDFVDVFAETYERGAGAVPIMVTAMGDIVYWQDGFVQVVLYRTGTIAVLASGMDMFFILLLAGVRDPHLAIEPYREAVPVLGSPDNDESFGYVPLLGLGGPARADHLQRVKTREHILLIAATVGPVR